jgi:uracil-DNA glycosylase
LAAPIKKLVAPQPEVIRGPGDSPNCSSCPFSDEHGKPILPVRGIGPKDPLFVIVGEGPGSNERDQGRPFIGASGILLNKALQIIGVDRNRAFITNALLCTPPGASDSQKRQARECCAPRLDAELALFPKVPVSALGAVAAQRLLGDKQSIKEMAGATYDLPDGRVVVPTTHPAAILRGSEQGEDQEGSAHRGDLAFWNLAYDIGKVVRFAEGKLVRFTEDVEIEYEDGARADALLEAIALEIIEDEVGACDTETDSLRPLLCTMTAIGLASRNRAVSVRWDILGYRGLTAIQRIFSRPWVRIAFHNSLYDVPVLRKHGFWLGCKWGDTLLMHHSAFPGLAHDLQRVLTQFFVAPPWKSEFRQGKKTKELFEAISERTTVDLGDDEVKKRWHALLWYNGLDTLATARLVKPLEECLTRFDAWASYQEDMDQVPIANDMHETGTPVDLQRNDEMGRFFELRLEKARAIFDAKAADPTIREKFLDFLAMEQAKVLRKGTKGGKGRPERVLKDGRISPAKPGKPGRPPDPPGYIDRWNIRLAELKAAEGTKKQTNFKIGAPMHIVAYLKARGIPLFLETAKGKLSAGEPALRPLRHLPEVQALLAYRENKTELGTFIVGVRKALYPDGRFHSRISISKITGRWSFEDPQAQNWTKGKPKWVCVHCGRMEKEHDKEAFCPNVLGKAEWPEGVYPNEWTKPEAPTKFKKEKGTYENWRKKWLLPDGSVHENGLQKAGVPNLRWQVVAPEGYVVVGFDMAQLEARAIALVSGDPWLINIFANGKDIHSEFARIVWPDFDQQQVDVRKRLRDFVKRPEYGAFYGGSVNTLWQNILKDDPKVKRQDIEKVVNVIRQVLKGVMAWHQALLKKVMMPPHEIRSLFGRRFVFPLGTCSPNDVYNATIQAFGRGVIARGLKNLRTAMDAEPEKWDRVEWCLDIHDACMFLTPVELAEEFTVLVKTSFTQTHTYQDKTVEFPADAKYAPDWAGV